jgi:hypothetical protein
MVFGSFAVGFGVPFLAGARGLPYLAIAIGAYFVVGGVAAYLYGQIFSQIKVDTRPHDSFPHIVPPQG